MLKLKIDLNIASVQKDNVHGTHKKEGVVLHETVSSNYKGLDDVRSVSQYLDNKDYGIHGITDADGNIAWSLGLGQSIFYHTLSQGNKGSGNVNTRFIGIEQVSRVMLDYKTRAARIKAWLHMDKEINATAKLVAAAARAHNFPIQDSDGSRPGVTTHWEVTMRYGVSGGHVDCWPVNHGGYFPKALIIKLAKRYYKAGYHF